MCLKDLNEVDVKDIHRHKPTFVCSSLGRSIIMWLFIHVLGSEDSRECVCVCV
jgi:hypothetical protein